MGVREHSGSVNQCIIRPVYQPYTNPPPLSDSAFSHFGLYKEQCLSEGEHDGGIDSLIFLKSDCGRIRSLFLCAHMWSVV